MVYKVKRIHRSAGSTESEPSEVITVNRNAASQNVHMEENEQCEQTSEEGAITRSLGHVEKQLRNVIDMMGPQTPKLPSFVASSDADNEDSVFSSTSIISSVLKVKQITKSDRPHDSKSPRYRIPREKRETNNELVQQKQSTPSEKKNSSTQYQKTFYISRNDVEPPMMGHTCGPYHQYVQHMPCNDQMIVRDMPPQMEQWIEPGYPSRGKRFDDRKSRLANWLWSKRDGPIQKSRRASPELYKIEMERPKDSRSPPRRFVFDLVDGVPGHNPPDEYYAPRKISPCRHCQQNRPKVCDLSPTRNGMTMRENPGCNYSQGGYDGKVSPPYPIEAQFKPKKAKKEKREQEKIDLYYFDHGNSAYYRTTDSPPTIHTGLLAEKTENTATKFWAEIFGTIHIGCAFVTTFILQLLRFILYSIFRPLTVGVIQLFSDYFIKPFLAVIFNGIVQPPLIMFYNVATSIRDLCEPLAQGIGYFFNEVATLLNAIRFVEYHKHGNNKKKAILDRSGIV